MPEIQQQLPAVTHSHVFLEMTEAQEKLQESLLNKIEDLKGESRKISGSKVVNGQLLSPEQLREYYDSVIQGLQTFLVETCDTPELLSHEEASNMSKSIISELGLSEKDIKKSPKLDQLKDFAKQIMNDEPSSKIVIFTEYERMARMIYNQLPHAVLYTGQISDREKENAVQRFREDPNTKIFISTRAGSTGLNLQVANYMIHFDLPYTATEIEQRNGRIDRTGNKFNNITMYYYVMSGSFEEHLIEMLHKKSLLANTILTGQSEKISNRSQDFSKIAFEKLAKKRLKSLQPA